MSTFQSFNAKLFKKYKYLHLVVCQNVIIMVP